MHTKRHTGEKKIKGASVKPCEVRIKRISTEEDKKVPPITSFFEAKKLKKGSVEEAEGKSEAGSSAMSSDTQDDA